MKKVLMITMMVLLVLSFMACGSKTETAASGTAVLNAPSSPLIGDPSEEYYMITFISGHDFWKPIRQGWEDAGKLYGVKAEYTGQVDADIAGEVAVLEQVIGRKPKGIAITCINSTAFADTINSAVRQGIAIVTFDSDSPTSQRAAYLATGNSAAGEKAAEYLSSIIGGKGKVAVLYTVGPENTEQRVAGFNKWIAAYAPGIIPIYVNDAGDLTTATENISAAIQANPDLAAVFCVDSTASTAGPTVVKETGNKNIKVLSFDIETTVLDMIKTGDIAATVAQGQYNMGYWSLNFLYHQAHGLPAENLPGFLDTGVTIVTKDTVDNYYPK
jgi:ribose transport system substrate-binding protein